MVQGQCLLAACGGDTVKLFDVSVETGDPCTFQYTPAHGSQVNCVKWNHTNLVIASAGEDRKISLWMKNGQVVGVVPQPGSDVGDNIDVLRVLDYSRLSRHILVTAGDDGSVHLWDTTGRSPKVSWIRQHSAPTTGVAFSSCNDKMLLSVGLDKKLYTYDPGLKKPVHCIPCEAPFSSLAFKDDGLILAVGTNSGRVVFYDVRGKPQPFTILRAYGLSEAVTSLCWQRSNLVTMNSSNCSLEVALLGVTAEDSVLMPDPLPAPATNTHGRPTLTSLPGRTSGRLTLSTAESPLASASAGAVLSSKPLVASEETPIFSGSRLWTKGAISRLQTSQTAFNLKDDMEVFSPLVDIQPLTPSVSNFWDLNEDLKTETSRDRKMPWVPTPPGEVRRFPSIVEELKDESRLSTTDHCTPPLQDDSQGRSCLSSPMASIPSLAVSPQGDRSPSVTPPEAWGGDGDSNKINFRQQATHSISRFASPTTLSSSAEPLQHIAASSTVDLLAMPVSASADSLNLGTLYSAHQLIQSSALDPSVLEPKLPASESSPILSSSSGVGFIGGKQSSSVSSLEASLSDSAMMVMTKKLPFHIEKSGHSGLSRNITSAVGDGAASSGVLLRKKKMLGEKNDDHSGMVGITEGKRDTETGYSLKSDATATGTTSTNNGNLLITSQRVSSLQDPNQQGPPSFALQLVQRTLEESLGAVQKAIHEDVQNLHLELLRQFHIQQTETSAQVDAVVAKQTEMMEEILNLRKEVQQLRYFLT
eukprot:c22566_g1_i1 orf=207-2480(+)